MSEKSISRRSFLKSVGAAAVGAAAVRMLGAGALASGEASGEPTNAVASQETGTFVYKPYWGPENVKTAVGGEILFFGDVHDFEDDYFYYDAATGETKGVFTYLVQGGRRPGLYACIGDYLQASSDIVEGDEVYSHCIDRIRAWGGAEARIVSVMGNHEFKTAGVGSLNGEQVFEKWVGNNNYGLVARGVDENDPDKTIYFVVAFGCAHTKEIDAANTRANAKNKYWVNPDEIDALDETLAEIYGPDGSRNQGIPTFIDAHLPVHYYTDERSAENNCDLLTVLNKYPYVVYVWGHNHSEKDPGYGTVKLPGNTIVPNAGLAEKNADGETAAREIRFTYVACGAVRGNQISDNALEDSERALYVTLDGSRLRFEYCGRDGGVFDRTALAGPREATYFEDFRTRWARSAAGLTVDLAAETDGASVRRGDFFLARPVAGQTPGGVVSFSERYRTSLEWRDSAGNPVPGAFAHDEAYTARLTLTSDSAAFALTGEDVYLFDPSAVVIPVRYILEKTVTVSGDGAEAVIEIAFAPTAAMADEPLRAASALEEGRRYALTSSTEQYLFTCARADCIEEDGTLLTVPDAEAYWTFEKHGTGWTMRSANGQYLTASINGPHVVLTPVADLSEGVYTEWSFCDGALHIDVSGYDYCFACADGVFALTTSPGDTACRLFALA